MAPKKLQKAASLAGLFFLFAVLVWSAVLLGLYSWNVRIETQQTSENALHEARAFFEEIVTTRYWNALHGGVYVPISEKTVPNPYLDIPDRDITTTEGRRLTKINPAYMTRQIGEIAAERNQVKFHITSRNPIRPANAPYPWEAAALDTFKEGTPEYAEFVQPAGGETVFRYMAPLWVEGPCLKCHAKQGYRAGDLRGGISVSINAGPLHTSSSGVPGAGRFSWAGSCFRKKNGKERTSLSSFKMPWPRSRSSAAFSPSALPARRSATMKATGTRWKVTS